MGRGGRTLCQSKLLERLQLHRTRSIRPCYLRACEHRSKQAEPRNIDLPGALLLVYSRQIRVSPAQIFDLPHCVTRVTCYAMTITSLTEAQLKAIRSTLEMELYPVSGSVEAEEVADLVDRLLRKTEPAEPAEPVAHSHKER